MGSNVSRTVNIGVSRLFPMAEAPKDVMVTSENVNTPQETMPQEEVRSTVPEVPESETIPGESSGAAPMKIGTSPVPSLTPMTPEEETVIKEPARKKTRRQSEMTALAESSRPSMHDDEWA